MARNQWQMKMQAAKRRSANQHAAKARIRQARPAPEYPNDRLVGRYANIVINFPWKKGNNTIQIPVDFAPRPHRSDRYIVNGKITTLTELCRTIMRKHLHSAKTDWK